MEQLDSDLDDAKESKSSISVEAGLRDLQDSFLIWFMAPLICIALLMTFRSPSE